MTVIQLLFKSKAKEKLININDEGDFRVDDAPDYIDEHCNATHSFSDCFRYGTK